MSGRAIFVACLILLGVLVTHPLWFVFTMVVAVGIAAACKAGS